MTAAPRIAMITPLGGSPFYGHSEAYQPDQPGGVIYVQPFDVDRLIAKGCTLNTASADMPALGARADALVPRGAAKEDKPAKSAKDEQAAS